MATVGVKGLIDAMSK